MSFFLLIFHTYTHPHISINCLTIEKKPTISNMYVVVYMCEKLTKKLKWFSCRQHKNNNNSEIAYLFVAVIPQIRRHATSEGSECLLFTSASSRTNRDSMLFVSSLFPIATLSKKNSATNYSACGIRRERMYL